MFLNYYFYACVQFGEKFRVYETSNDMKKEIKITQWTADSPYLHPSHKAVLWTEDDKLVAIFKLGDTAIFLTAKWLRSKVDYMGISGYEEHANFVVWVPDDYKGKTLGLLGNNDVIIYNDYTNRKGVTLLGYLDPNTKSRIITNHMMDCELIYINACMHAGWIKIIKLS